MNKNNKKQQKRVDQNKTINDDIESVMGIYGIYNDDSDQSSEGERSENEKSGSRKDKNLDKKPNGKRLPTDWKGHKLFE